MVEHCLSFEFFSHIYIDRGVEIVSQLPDILAYFNHSCPAPYILYIQYSSDSIHHTFTRFTGQCPA